MNGSYKQSPKAEQEEPREEVQETPWCRSTALRLVRHFHHETLYYFYPAVIGEPIATEDVLWMLV